MRPRIKVLTLGVDDLEASLAFYRDGLGLPTKGIVGTEYEDGAVVFIDVNQDLVLALYPRASLAKSAGIAVSPRSPSDFTLGHNVATRDEVDRVMLQAEQAGARIVKRAADTFWGGYAGYFQDPDGHLWEVAWNPEWAGRE